MCSDRRDCGGEVVSDQVRWHSLGVWQIGWLVGALGVHSIPPQHTGFQVLHPVAVIGLAVWGLAGSWLGRGGGGIRTMVSAGAVIAYCLLVAAADVISLPVTSGTAVLSSAVWLLAAIAMSDPTPDATVGVLIGGAALLSGAILLVSGGDRGFGWMAVGLGLAVGGVAMVVYVDPTIARGVVLCGVGVSLLGLGLAGQSGDYLIFDMVLIAGGALLGLYGISCVPAISGRVRASPGTAGYVGGGDLGHRRGAIAVSDGSGSGSVLSRGSREFTACSIRLWVLTCWCTSETGR